MTDNIALNWHIKTLDESEALTQHQFLTRRICSVCSVRLKLDTFKGKVTKRSRVPCNRNSYNPTQAFRIAYFDVFNEPFLDRGINFPNLVCKNKIYSL